MDDLRKIQSTAPTFLAQFRRELLIIVLYVSFSYIELFSPVYLVLKPVRNICWIPLVAVAGMIWRVCRF